ncbi:MAG TPA: hypothetical protein ENK02_05605 [Planctomycetes bacterium]|nr:hypothetical protein [Planctomycetota bacterium]
MGPEVVFADLPGGGAFLGAEPGVEPCGEEEDLAMVADPEGFFEGLGEEGEAVGCLAGPVEEGGAACRRGGLREGSG